MRFALLFLALVLALSAPVTAGTCDLTEFPSTGTLTAERLNQRIRQTERCVNGNIGNGNWNSGEKLDLSNLSTPRALHAISWTVSDEDGDATAGEDVAAGANVRQWAVPPALVTALRADGLSVYARCVGACTPGITVTLNRTGSGSTTLATTTVTAGSTLVVTDGSGSIQAGEQLYLTITGTNFTNVKFLDVVAWVRAYHQT